MYMYTKQIKKLLSIALAGVLLLSASCQSQSKNNKQIETTAPAVEIQAELGKEAEYGGMKMTVLSAEDPDIIVEQSGKMAVFFQVQISNSTDETISANWLNNFSITIDGTDYDSDVCCTIPVMKKLYDFYGVDAMNEEIPAGESKTGYIACEADKDFQELAFHYIPKTTDRASKITVTVTREQLEKAEKNS